MVGEQIPGFVLALVPVEDEPKPASIVLLRETYPTDGVRLTGQKVEVIELALVATW